MGGIQNLVGVCYRTGSAAVKGLVSSTVADDVTCSFDGSGVTCSTVLRLLDGSTGDMLYSSSDATL